MCCIFKYNQRQDLYRSLLADASPADLSRRCNFTEPVLARHQEHLQQAAPLHSLTGPRPEPVRDSNPKPQPETADLHAFETQAASARLLKLPDQNRHPDDHWDTSGNLAGNPASYLIFICNFHKIG
jgi:hypothetical protein